MAPLISSQRSVSTPFLTKTYQLVDDETIDHVISWNDDGSTFIVWNTRVFARDLLPKYFKHNNFTSFLRQLNTYGFKKVESDRLEFSNDCFRRGNKQLLLEIQRRKLSTPVASTAANAVVSMPAMTITCDAAIPTAQPVTLPEDFGERQPMAIPTDLIDENTRLRKERVQLMEQLIEVKCLCNNIFLLMSNFAKNQSKSSFRVRESVFRSTESLDLFPVRRSTGDGEAGLNQVGSPVVAKRVREYREGYSTSPEDDTTLRLQPPEGSGESNKSR